MPRPNRGPRLEIGESGFYEIRWTENGRSKRRSTGTSDSGEAQRRLAGFLQEVERLGSPDRLTVREAAASYLAEHVAERVIGKDNAAYALAPVLRFFGDMQIAEITPRDVDRYVRDRRAGKLSANRRQIADGTIRRELGAMSAAMNYAARNRMIPRDLVPTITPPAQPEAKDRWLTQDEARRLLNAAGRGWSLAAAWRAPRIFRFIKLGLETAARRGALEGLTWFQVKFDEGLIYLNPPGRKQTKKRRAVVPISDELMPYLRRWAGERVRDPATGELSPYVLDHAGSVFKTFNRTTARVGLDDVTPHTMRHTWAVWAAQDGVDLWKIGGILGDSMRTVERHYLHHCPQHLRDAVNRRRVDEVEEDGRG